MTSYKSGQASNIQPVRSPAEAGQRDAQEFDVERISAEHYEHRGRIRKELTRGDWWVAIAVYLLLSGVALVIF